MSSSWLRSLPLLAKAGIAPNICCAALVFLRLGNLKDSEPQTLNFGDIACTFQGKVVLPRSSGEAGRVRLDLAGVRILASILHDTTQVISIWENDNLLSPRSQSQELHLLFFTVGTFVVISD
jgi:hypothetical protein